MGPTAEQRDAFHPFELFIGIIAVTLRKPYIIAQEFTGNLPTTAATVIMEHDVSGDAVTQAPLITFSRLVLFVVNDRNHTLVNHMESSVSLTAMNLINGFGIFTSFLVLKKIRQNSRIKIMQSQLLPVALHNYITFSNRLPALYSVHGSDKPQSILWQASFLRFLPFHSHLCLFP